MSSPDGRPVFIPRVPWHKPEQSPHWFCEGEKCERDCHCPKRVKDKASERQQRVARGDS